MPDPTLLRSIASTDLAIALGGASRVSSRSSGSTDQLTLMLTQITSSINQLASNKGQNDPMQMMMLMMMMMGGGGGGGGGGAPPPPGPPPQAPPAATIRVSSVVC